ncbi:MAG: hypothetical protein AAF585_13820 [Verrucomicrobiota bacterium]
MPRAKKSWREKLADDNDLPKFFDSESNSMTAKWGSGRVVIPRPRDVDALMEKVPKGKLTTINELRAGLAEQHDAEFTCQITAGIFAWIAANAANEAQAEGRKRVTPFWRTLKKGGEVNPKYPGGLEAQRQLLEAEGHEVYQKGKRLLVRDYEKKLCRPSAEI